MSEASIVQNLTINTVATFTTPTGVDRVKIHNDSSYYLRVSFGLGAPGSANASGWNATVGPGASPVLPVVGASSGAVGLDLTNARIAGTYQGQIIILPFLPVGASVASGGVLTGAALCYITAFYPDEYAEPGGQIEAFVQAAKQARGQEAGPGGVVPGEVTFTDATASATLTLIDTIGNSATSPLFLANVAGNSVINLYLFGWGGSLRNDNPNVATLDTIPSFAVTDSTGATVRQAASGDPGRIARAVNMGADSWWYPFPNPMLLQFSFTQGALAFNDSLRYRYVKRAGTGTFSGYLYFAYMLDKVNQTPLTAFPPNPGPPAIVANQPWNATYNPQTY